MADAESSVGDPGVEHGLLPDGDEPAEVDPYAQAAASVYGFEAFEPAPTDAVEPVAALDDPRRAPALVARFASEALAVEGPIEIDRLVRIVAARCGLSRVVQRRRDGIVALLPADAARTEGGRFVWPTGVDPASWTRARRADARVRGISEISLAELVHGMSVLLEGAFSMTNDELISEAARAFGFGRVTAPVRERMQAAIDEGVSDGRLLRAGERLELA